MSREVGEGLGWCLVVEAPEAGFVVAIDESVEEGVALDMRGEPVLATIAAGWVAAQSVGEAAVEALGHAVGLRVEWAGEPMIDVVPAADEVEGMLAGGPAGVAPAGGAEAIGELGTIVGEDGVYRIGEGGEQAHQAGGDGAGVAPFNDLDVDEPGGPVDGDEHVAGMALEPGQVLEVDVDEAHRSRLEAPHRRLGG
ncbi:hypothetical protein VW23_010455 [Devosia insulae DS-56]|uniref:Uncharacterized protein n=1 Tax=Devosia insulae DS-56 TaxID=1116389 RepID=A0A1E5XVL1_9HYPH|nr:hypothetical protein [Devosia insulae]OEO32627.1 hypothetical protein VW23_010455 [Devosia insulae DS-56]